MGSTVEAAGGVLWRTADTRLGVEIALVHRPAQGDWSLPKGRLLPGEHPILGALREVAEETGYTGAVGRRLGAVHYRKDGADKRVRYWAMGAEAGSFRESDEVDDLVWLPPDAAARLARGRDRVIIDTFGAERPDREWPLLLVHHGKAVPARRWTGDDRDRPLDRSGRRQASALAPLLDAYRVRRALAPDVERCRQTLRPIEKRHGLEVECENLLSPGRSGARSRALRRLTELATDGVPTVICADRAVLSRLCAALADLGGNRRSGTRSTPGLPKAAAYALHLHDRKGPRARPPERVA
jgi:8-oxo-dGTP diphosphatase